MAIDLDLEQAEDRLWQLLDRQDSELEALVETLTARTDDRLFKVYALSCSKMRKRSTRVISQTYIDHKKID